MLADFNIYGGVEKAAAAIDASGATPSYEVKVSLVKFDAYPFLRDAANFQSLEGKAQFPCRTAARGVA
jgi:hypothetical protein